MIFLIKVYNNNQSTYIHIIENIDTKTFNNINKSIIDSTINLTNLINENILNNFEIITKSNESLQLY